jgi:hypothetical protein
VAERFGKGVDRRRFLRLTAGAAAGGLLQACGGGGQGTPAAAVDKPRPAVATTTGGAPIFVPKVNNGLNVHGLRRLDVDPHETEYLIVPELVSLQLRTAYELGFDGIRIEANLYDTGGMLAAIPYVRGARALGIDAIVLIGEAGGVTTAHELWLSSRRSEVLDFYNRVYAPAPKAAAAGAGGLGPGGAGRIAFQILNEPAGFSGLPPHVYVREILTPCFQELKGLNPQILVVSAAEVGNVDGPPRVREMLEAGLELVCDRIAFHVYSREIIDQLPEHVRSVLWITETGVADTSQHLAWVRDVYPQMEAHFQDLTRIFYYDLYDKQAGGYRLINFGQTAEGYERVVESTALYDYFTQRVTAAAAGRPLLSFDELIPDIRAYFPTAADTEAVADILGVSAK